jgi:nitrate reductase beta subunit
MHLRRQDSRRVPKGPRAQITGLNTWRVCPLQALRKLVAVRIYKRSKNAAEPGLADRARQALAEVDLTEQDVEEMYKLFAIAWRDRFVIHTNPRRCAN